MVKDTILLILTVLAHVTLVQGSLASYLSKFLNESFVRFFFLIFTTELICSTNLSGGVEKPIEHCSECTLKVIEGLSEDPSEDDQRENYICESSCAGEIDSHFYSFKGDVESFFSDKLESGTIRINVPEYARYEDSTIDLESLSIEDVTIDKRRRLANSAMRQGNKKILVVLVKDRFGNKPQQSRQEMEHAIFGGDGIGVNLVSVILVFKVPYKICSLTIKYPVGNGTE